MKMKIKTHILYLIIVLFVYLVLPAKIFSVTSNLPFIGKNFSSANAALGEAGYNIPNNPITFFEHPAQLYWVSIFDIGFTYQRDLLDRDFIGGYFASSGLPVSLGISFQALVPSSIDDINNLGITQGTYRIFDYMTGIHLAHKIKAANYTFYVGYDFKYYYEEIVEEKVHTILFDIGFLFPINVNALKISKKYSRYNNLVISFRALNMGYSIAEDGSRFPGKLLIKNTATPPTLSIGFNYNIIYHKNHIVDFVYTSDFIIEDYLDRKLIYHTGFGVQYTLFKIISLRFGTTYKSEEITTSQFVLYSGIGINIEQKKIYNIELAYTIQGLSSLSLEHRIDFRIGYNFLSLKQRIRKQFESVGGDISEINQEVLTIVKNAIQNYKLEKNVFPKKLADILPILKKEYNLTSLPKPSSGRLYYTAANGKVVVVRGTEAQTYKNIIELKDGSIIKANIKKDKLDSLLIQHQYGENTIQKSNIKKVTSDDISSLDKDILKSIQGYVKRFYQQYKRNPRDLKEILSFLSIYQIKRLPQPSSGDILYDPQTGLVSIGIEYNSNKNKVTKKFTKKQKKNFVDDFLKGYDSDDFK